MIHVPESIQPHGVLLVVDLASDRVVRAAGNMNDLCGIDGSMIDRKCEDIIGIRASALVEMRGRQRTAARIDCAGIELMAAAHQQADLVVVELERAVPPRSSEALLHLIDWASHHLSSADNVADAARFASDAIREISGYDRVLAYRFASDCSGIVIAEQGNDIFPTLLNHRFPESDIPSQARALYFRNPVRAIPDAAHTPAALLPALAIPLDMTDCILRSVSPYHLQYLTNMGVRGSMSVSVVVDGSLWGLLAAHSRDARYVSPESRELCKLVGWMLARKIEVIEQKRRLHESHELTAKREEILLALRSGIDPESYLGAVLPALCELVHSDGVALVSGAKLQTAGLVPPNSEINEIVAWLATKTDHPGPFATDNLAAHLPPVPGISWQASGLLSILIPSEHPIRLIWFRAEQVMEVEWAGNPHAKTSEDAQFLSPRKSFEVWRQTVRQHSRKWTDAETESAQLFATRTTAILQGQSIRRLNSALQSMNAELSVEAATDPLTGLANRRSFNRSIREQWELATTHGQHLSVVMCDVDFFKTYNDYFGHSAGDVCLKQVSRVLTDHRRSSDTAARVGGEEFCLLLPHTDLDGALAFAEHIRAQIEMLAIENPGSPSRYVTISLGVAANDSENVTNERELIEAADAALYRAKNGGRNRVVGSAKPPVADHQKSLSSSRGAPGEAA